MKRMKTAQIPDSWKKKMLADDGLPAEAYLGHDPLYKALKTKWELQGAAIRLREALTLQSQASKRPSRSRR